MNIELNIEKTVYLQGNKGKLYFTYLPGNDLRHVINIHAEKNDVIIFQETWYRSYCHTIFAEACKNISFDSTKVFILNNTSDYKSLKSSDEWPVPFSNYRLIPHNIFISPKVWFPKSCEKKYDFVLNTNSRPYKRDNLANKVPGAHVLAYTEKKDNLPPVLPAISNRRVQLKKVKPVLDQCSIGLILSKEEGCCWASGEYLMCGLPVVSTKSLGGRDYQYTDYNSIICEDNQDAVKEASLTLLERLKSGRINPLDIHSECMEINKPYIKKFHNLLEEVFEIVGITDPKNTIKEILSSTDHFAHYVENENIRKKLIERP